MTNRVGPTKSPSLHRGCPWLGLQTLPWQMVAAQAIGTVLRCSHGCHGFSPAVTSISGGPALISWRFPEMEVPPFVIQSRTFHCKPSMLRNPHLYPFVETTYEWLRSSSVSCEKNIILAGERPVQQGGVACGLAARNFEPQSRSQDLQHQELYQTSPDTTSKSMLNDAECMVHTSYSPYMQYIYI